MAHEKALINDEYDKSLLGTNETGTETKRFQITDTGRLKVDSDTVTGSEYDTTSIDTTDPNEIVITYKLSGVTVATETITVSGSLIEITKT